jgi:hypothetical protein
MGKLHFRLGVKRSAVATKDVHQEQFGRQLSGRDLILKEYLEAGLESVAEVHGKTRKQKAESRRRKAVTNRSKVFTALDS